MGASELRASHELRHHLIPCECTQYLGYAVDSCTPLTRVTRC